MPLKFLILMSAASSAPSLVLFTAAPSAPGPSSKNGTKTFYDRRPRKPAARCAHPGAVRPRFVCVGRSLIHDRVRQT